MGTRCLTRVFDDGQEILCLYRQYDGYPDQHGAELKSLFGGFTVVNGISGDTAHKANGMGCFAAQLVHAFKRAPIDVDSRAFTRNGAIMGSFYIYAPGTHDVGEEYVYSLYATVTDAKKDHRKLWLRIQEPDQPSDQAIYDGWLDSFDLADCREPPLYVKVQAPVQPKQARVQAKRGRGVARHE